MRASARRSRRPGRGSTRCGPPWAGWTAPTATGTWCACAHRWKPTPLPLTDGGRARGGAATAAEPGAAAGRSGAPGCSTGGRWQLLLEPQGRSGPENMAVDVALLERADRMGEAFLRLYRFDPPSACFSQPVGGEVLLRTRKLVGSAQMRRGGAFLQHGSILLDGSQDVIAAVTREPQAASAATTLSEELGRRITWEEVADAIVATWDTGVTSPNLHQPPPTSIAWFSDPAWTWRR